MGDSGYSVRAAAVSESESVRYDRQVRLWGVAMQQKIQSAHALWFQRGAIDYVLGQRGGTPLCTSGADAGDGLVGEVCKNLVLAGVKSLTAVALPQRQQKFQASAADPCDGLDKSPLSSAANFFGRRRDAPAALLPQAISYVQELNPFVALQTVPLVDEATRGIDASKEPLTTAPCPEAMTIASVTISSVSPAHLWSAAASAAETSTTTSAEGTSSPLLSVLDVAALQLGPYTVAVEQLSSTSLSPAQRVEAVIAALASLLGASVRGVADNTVFERAIVCQPRPVQMLALILALIRSGSSLLDAQKPADESENDNAEQCPNGHRNEEDDDDLLSHLFLAAHATTEGWSCGPWGSSPDACLVADQDAVEEACQIALTHLGRRDLAAAVLPHAPAPAVLAHPSPSSTVIDTTTAGGIVGQRILNRVSELPCSSSAGSNATFVAMRTSGLSIECFVGRVA